MYVGMASVGFFLLPGWLRSRKINDDINMVDVSHVSDPFYIIMKLII